MKGYRLEPRLLRKMFHQEYGFDHAGSFKKEFRQELTQQFGKDPRQWGPTEDAAFHEFMQQSDSASSHTTVHSGAPPQDICHRCNGSGKLFGHMCATCGGAGRVVEKTETFDQVTEELGVQSDKKKYQFDQVVDHLTESLTDQPVFVHDNTNAFNNWKRIKNAVLLNNEVVEVVLEDGEKIPLPLNGPLHNYRLMLNDGQFTTANTIAQIYGLLERPKVLAEDGVEEGRYLGPIRPGSDRDLMHRDVAGSEPGEKDYMRIRDLKRRANGMEWKMLDLARQMSQKIKAGSEKAHRRAIAAQDVYPGPLGRRMAAIFLRGY